MSILQIVAGLALLAVGAELLVKGASRLARLIGISPLVVGLTVVAYGTSAPELVVSADAAMRGNPGLAIGNAVGSNILNVLLILGVCAVIRPLAISASVVRRDLPVLICASVLMLLLCSDRVLSRFEGCLLLTAFVAYSLVVVWISKQAARDSEGQVHTDLPEDSADHFTSAASQLVLSACGLAVLVLGARSLVGGASTLAAALGVSDALIGLTIVALGTSMPEIAVSIAATARGARDIAVGNVVGSNIFNLLAALGLAAFLAPSRIVVPEEVLRFDIPVMVAVAVACYPIFLSTLTILRWEGWLFLAYYAAYTAFLIMTAHRHEMLPAYGDVMRLVVIPVTALVLVVVLAGAIRRGDYRET